MARLVAERQDVVPVLAEIFREHGYEAASLTIISQRTGLGKGSLYHFFPGGKEDMVTAVFADIAGWFEAHVFHPLEHGEPKAAIMGMFAAVTDYFRSGQRVCLVGAVALNDGRDRFARFVKPYFDRWLAALTDALARRGVGEGEAARLSREVVAGIQGAIILARALNDEAPFREAVERLATRCFAAAPR